MKMVNMKVKNWGCLCLLGGVIVVTIIWITVLITIYQVIRVTPTKKILTETYNIQQNENFQDEKFPKIIHQIWLDIGDSSKKPKMQWQNASALTRKMNPDFSYKLWKDDDVVELIRNHYRWFLPTYHSYPYDIMRVDAARYFILQHHGGIYLDFDEISLVPISEIIEQNKLDNFDCLLPSGTVPGLTTYIHVIMCKEHSKFMASVVSDLQKKNGWYGIPYATVMWSTGSRFLWGVYDHYQNKQTIFVMSSGDVEKYFLCLSSWFSIDGKIFHVVVYPFITFGVSWTHLILIVIFVVVGLIFYCWLKSRNFNSERICEQNDKRLFLALRPAGRRATGVMRHPASSSFICHSSSVIHSSIISSKSNHHLKKGSTYIQGTTNPIKFEQF